MTDDQIAALIYYVRCAVNSAVARTLQKDDWAHDRLDDAERELVEALKAGHTE